MNGSEPIEFSTSNDENWVIYTYFWGVTHTVLNLFAEQGTHDQPTVDRGVDQGEPHPLRSLPSRAFDTVPRPTSMKSPHFLTVGLCARKTFKNMTTPS